MKRSDIVGIFTTEQDDKLLVTAHVAGQYTGRKTYSHTEDGVVEEDEFKPLTTVLDLGDYTDDQLRKALVKAAASN